MEAPETLVLDDRQINYFMQLEQLKAIQDGHTFDLVHSSTNILERMKRRLPGDEQARIEAAQLRRDAVRPIICKLPVPDNFTGIGHDFFGVCFLIQERRAAHPAYAYIGEICCGAVTPLPGSSLEDTRHIFSLLQELEQAKENGLLPDLSLNMTAIGTPYGVSKMQLI